MSGPLRVGVIPSVAPYLLPPLLPLLRAEHPELELHVRETQTLPLTHELVEGKLDVLLLALPVTHPDVETLALFEDRFLLALPRSRKFPASLRATKTSSSTSGCSCSSRACRPGARLLQPAAGELGQHVRRLQPGDDRGDGGRGLRHHAAARDLPAGRGRERELALMPFAEPEPFRTLGWHGARPRRGAPISWSSGGSSAPRAATCRPSSTPQRSAAAAAPASRPDRRQRLERRGACRDSRPRGVRASARRRAARMARRHRLDGEAEFTAHAQHRRVLGEHPPGELGEALGAAIGDEVLHQPPAESAPLQVERTITPYSARV